jgi:hypothetical protein
MQPRQAVSESSAVAHHLTHEKIPHTPNCKSTNMGSIEEALIALDLLEPGKRPNYAKVAKTYGVHRSSEDILPDRRERRRGNERRDRAIVQGESFLPNG